MKMIERLVKMFIPKDEMTPRERMEAFSKGEAYDRVPCCPFTGESYANHFGYGLDEYNHSQAIIIDVIKKTFDMFEPDNCSIGPGLHGMPEAMGAELSFFKNDIPRIKTPRLKTYDEIDALEIVDPYKDGRLNIYIEALKEMQALVGYKVCVGNTIGGPFTTAAMLVGTERFLKDLIKQKESIHKLLKITTESTLRFMDAVMDLGIQPGMADPIASSHLISPRMYREFVFPYTKICQDHIKKRMGSGGVLHICGKTKPIWDDMVATGIGGLSLDNQDDIGELRSKHEGTVTVIGNVDPVSVMKYGKKEDIYEAVKVCCDKALGSRSGFVLATGCDIPIGTPPENVKHMLDAARIYGNMR